MLERYEIENIEQLRAIADVLRLRIIDVLERQPMTVTQLGEALGLTPAKVHYHVRELERVGLLRLVETREKGGILEKYYQPIAHDIKVEQSLLSASADDAMATISAWLGQVINSFLRTLRQEFEKKDEKHEGSVVAGLSFSRLFITSDELKQLYREVHELFKPYEAARDVEGELEVLAMILTYSEDPSQVPPSTLPPEDAAWVDHSDWQTLNKELTS